MKPYRAKPIKKWYAIIVGLVLAGETVAQDLRETLFSEADRARIAAQTANAQLLSPQFFTDGMEAYAAAENDLERGRNLERVRRQIVEATASFNEAAEVSAIANTTLTSLISVRDDAIEAFAQRLATQLWTDAENLFDSAARRLELGDIEGTRILATEAEIQFREAELDAIKAQYLSQTRALLAEAEQLRVPRYAPETFNKAKILLLRAEEAFNNNRYETDLPLSLVHDANYEARHAIYLAERVRLLRDQDWTEEQLILSYEESIAQIAAATDSVAQLDRGPNPVTQELIAYIQDMRQSEIQLGNELEESHLRIVGLEEEIRDLDEQLGGIAQEQVVLVQLLEAEARIREQFAQIESTFSRNEALIYREGNNIIIRLVALTFQSGEPSVDREHRALLIKVRDAVEIFPRSRVVIEGHTDSNGSARANMSLSRARAESVGQYLSTELNIAAFRLSAIGYGETRPIANNETLQGRTQNRRIDILIEPQIE